MRLPAANVPVAGLDALGVERKRPFSLLRLTGARLSTPRGVVPLEGAVPLLTVAAVAIGTRFGTASGRLEPQHPVRLGQGNPQASHPR